MKNCKIRIEGEVQGVFFRAEAKKKADELKINGFVRNEEDGSVYAEVEGEESLIEDFLNWIRNGGPELARVEKVDFEYDENLKKFEDFSIRA